MNIFEELTNLNKDILEEFKKFSNIARQHAFANSIYIDIEESISHITSIISSSYNSASQKLNLLIGAKNRARNFVRSIEKFDDIDDSIHEILSILREKANSIESIENQKNTLSTIENEYKDYYKINKEPNNNNEKITNNKIIELKNRALEGRLEEANKKLEELEKINQVLKEQAEKSIAATVEDLKSKADSKIRNAIDFINKELPEANKRLKSLSALNGIEGGQLLATHYQKAAKLEYFYCNTLRVFVIALLCISALFSFSIAGTRLFESSNGNSVNKDSNSKPKEALILNYETNDLLIILSAKISLIFITLGSASWLAKESTKHRNRATFLSNKSIALNTIDLYIASFNDEQKTSLKIELSKYFFANESTQPDNDKDGIGINPQELANKIIEKINIGKEK